MEQHQIEAWATELDQVMQRIGGRFVRSEARTHAGDYLQGRLSPAERKNGWQLAEVIGDSTPSGIQQFLYRAAWDPDAVRDDLRTYGIEQRGDPAGVLIVDETGVVKKGTHSTGVKRQDRGTAGRSANSQVGVFLGYASRHGHAVIDRALYLPAEWTADRDRCQQAGIPDEVSFTTKPDLAWRMLHQAIRTGVPCTWVTGDSIYGDYRSMRLWLETLPKGYVLAVSGKEYVNIGWHQSRVGNLLAQLPSDGWSRLSAGDGAKGPRLYDWLRISLMDPLVAGWKRWLLVRRSISDPTELTAYACCAPADTPLETLVQVAAQRWNIEACFEEAKGEVGLDQYEVRSWTGWYRHITLACLAHALLALIRASTQTAALTPKRGD